MDIPESRALIPYNPPPKEMVAYNPQPNTRKVPPNIEDIPPIEENVPPKTGKVPPNTERIPPNAGKVSPGKPKPNMFCRAGTYIKDNGKKAAKAVYNGTLNVINRKGVQHGTAAAIAAITLYNIVDNGLDRGKKNANEELAEDYTDLFARSQTSPYKSNLLEKTKGFFREKMFDNSLYPACIKIKDGIGGLVGETLNNWLNIAAVTGVFVPAFMKNTTNPIVKKVIPAVSAAILLTKATKALVIDVLGFGKKGL
ncbi:MAG: hypothetical protein A2Y25_05865 [Candidatus Melainabacteria bacterium GWF2_37_15]|nr:MAG: hypothetical protein A2Y25_05865 [Candidatus Melainabacteria bacterium GWF2_37_15]